MTRVALFDYGTGNLHSLTRALERHGAVVRVEREPGAVLEADAVVLPGVGAFGAAAERLAAGRAEIVAALEDGFPCLGICLGMQLLLDRSEESPGEGLGFIEGNVRRLRAHRVPQMGWNDVELLEAGGAPDPLFAEVTSRSGSSPNAPSPDAAFAGDPDAEGPVVYYANTFVPEPTDAACVIARTAYEDDRFAAAVRKHNTWGVQFHPEKSSSHGLRMVRNFLTEVGR